MLKDYTHVPILREVPEIPNINQVSEDYYLEVIVLNYLAEAWNAFVKLEQQHPDELSDFKDAIPQSSVCSNG